MCSILLVLSLCIVIFTLISDYNRFCIGTLDLQIALEQHGFANQKTGRQTCTGPSQIRLVPSQTWLSDPVKPTFETNPPSAAKTSFQGSSIPCKDHRRDERRCSPTMEVPPMQAHLQWETRALCKVRPIMEDDNGHQFCSSGSSYNSTKSAMEPRPMVRTIPLGTSPMDQISQTKAVPKAEIQKRSTGTTCKRKRQAEASRRPGAVWSTIAACYAFFGTSMDDSLNSSAQHVLGSFSIPDVIGQRRQGQGEADAIFGCSTQEAPRRSARGCPSLDEKDVSIRAGQQETKQLHAAVSQHGRAKREIADAQAARLNMHVAWKNFLSQSVQQWTAYTNQFMSQEKQLMDRLKAAQENLTIAKENLSSSQSAAGVVPKEDAAMTSDTEDIPAKEHESAAGEKIAASFQDLANNLQALHTQAVQAVQQEVDQHDQLRKRPRVDSPHSKEKDKETPHNPGFGEGE